MVDINSTTLALSFYFSPFSSLAKVLDLKQFNYCGRVFFFMHCLPRVRPITYKMQAGIDEHEVEQKRSLRRTLSKFEVEGEGKREFDVAISDEALAMRGLMDEVVTTAQGEIFPVDYKLSDKAGEHFKLQLAFYTILLERERKKTIARGFLYLIPVKQLVEVKISERLRKEVLQQIEQMQQVVRDEAMPPATEKRARCIDCEFRRFCNDVL